MIFKTCLFRLCPPKTIYVIFRFHLFYTCECVYTLCVPLHMLCMLPTKPKRAPGPLNWSYKQLSSRSSVYCKGISAPKHWGAPPVLQLSLSVKYTLLGQEDELVTAMDKWNQQRAGLRKQLTLTLLWALMKLITDATSQSVILRKIMTFQISQYTLHENWCLVPESVSIALLQKTTKAL